MAGLETGRSAGDDAKPVGTGGPDNDRGLSVTADGRLVTIYTRFSSENDRFVVELTLHSPVLNERHGSPLSRFEK